MVIDLVYDGMFNPNGYENSSTDVRTSLRAYLQQVTNKQLSLGDRLKAQRTFVNEMAYQARKGKFEELDGMRKKASLQKSGYHKVELEDIIANREFLGTNLKELSDAQTGEAAAMQLPNTPYWRPKKAPTTVVD